MLRVIIADDEPLWMRGLREVLTKAFERPMIEETNSGRGAIRRVAKNEYDIAIVGIPVADIDGLDLLERLTKMRPQMPVLFAGQHTADHYAPLTTKAGGQCYVSKRCTVDEIVSTIRKVLKERF